MGAGTVSCKVINFLKPEITKWPEVERKDEATFDKAN